ncbi:MAG: DUF262 domain-containing protein [Paludibacter sp.]|nr:DUF262 domain-containing protein [Paludibacter sp.]
MLISGDSYSIKDIFSGNYKIVVPDMQREYCWSYTFSDINNKSLVENFISDIIQNLNDEDLQMGLLYGYESPKDDIQLCDGQQRLTTLYILIGVLCRNLKEGDLQNALRNILISDFELHHDDREPRLQYAIRESTLFFLRDLVYYYFLRKEHVVEEGRNGIKKEFWYFDEYNLDPSIKNILKAIDIIEGLLKGIEIETLADRVTSCIRFLYFDMMNRNHGEEQFVVLNTTGKPLTVTDNLKPKFLGGLDNKINLTDKGNKTAQKYYSDLWEEWEHFFFVNRPKEHQTADDGLSEFFRWIYIVEQSNISDSLSSNKEYYNPAQKALLFSPFDLFELNVSGNLFNLLDLIQSYYKTLQQIVENEIVKKRFLFKKDRLSQIACFEFLPLFAYVQLFEITPNERRFIRVMKFFHSRAKIENVSKASITTTIEAIKIVKLLKARSNSDIISLIDCNEEVNSTILSEVEIFKFKVYKNNIDLRTDFEHAFWMAEGMQCCNGDIEYLFEVLDIDIKSENYKLDLARITKLINLLENSIIKQNDLMRRAMLCFGDYSGWHGSTPSLDANRYTLGNRPEYYKTIVQDKSNIERRNVVIRFLKELFSLSIIDEKNISNKYEEIIKLQTFEELDSSRKIAFKELIINSELITFMSDKLFSESSEGEKIYALRNTKVTGSDSYRQIV